MNILVWQWGRRGAGPRYAAGLAESLGSLPGTSALLSLSAQSELLASPAPPACALPFPTYRGIPSLIARAFGAPILIPRLAAALRRLRPDIAICAMPAPLDLLMAAALRRIGTRILVVVHDAALHPGDGFPFQMTLQRALMRRADGLIVLSAHVAAQLRAQGLVGARPLLATTHPPFAFGPPPPPPGAHGGRRRLLSFGRLLPYKGLDLLRDALALLGPRDDMELRIVGSGPESPELAALRAMPGVSVENRWVPEAELAALLAWADALVLSHREASQSGVAAAAIAANRWIVATRVGGLAEQLGAEKLARLCEPDAESLAAALRTVLENPPPPVAPADPRAVWLAVAADLAAQIAVAFP
jgi:glycosyltransferase involved in cell wall biosynthesis